MSRYVVLADVERIVIARWEIEGNALAQGNLDRFAKQHKIPIAYIELDQLS